MSISINSNNKYYNFAKAAAVGTLAGAVETVVGLPTTNICNALITGNPVPKNSANLFRGWKIQFPTMMAFFSLVISSNYLIKQKIEQSEGNNSSFLRWTSAATSGACGTVILNPLESVIIQMAKRKSQNAFSTAKEMYQEGGYKAFKRGWIPMVFRNAIYSTGVLAATDVIWKGISSKNNAENQFYEKLAASSIAGGLVSIASQPFHVMSVQCKASDLTKPYTISMNGGFSSFYKGSLPRFIRMSVGSAMVYTTVNYFMNNQK